MPAGGLIRTATAIAAASIATGAAGQAQPPEPIWQTIVAGDSADDVAAKLLQLPEVKAAKVKRRKSGDTDVAVSYRGAGFTILGGTFEIDPVFAGDHATRVNLLAQPACVQGIGDRYSALFDLLVAKYPKHVEGSDRPDGSDFLKAFSAATAEAPAHVTAAVGDDYTVVFLSAIVTRTDPPPAVYSSSKTVRALDALLWNEYNSRAAQCGGDATFRVALTLTYLPMSEFQKISADAIARDAQDKAQAAAKL